MLSRGTAVITDAWASGHAVGAFATYNLEQVEAVVAAGEQTRRPVLMLVGSSHFRHADRRLLAGLALTAARHAPTEVGVHLDHCQDLDELSWCVDAGYSSVMYDGSHEPFETNVAATAEAARIAHAHGAWVEGELGALGGDEDVSTDAHVGALTDPQQAAEFVARTGVDALAVAVGNVHGFSPTARLDLERLAEIREAVSVPLVLHGASGLSITEIQAAIKLGVAKINVNAELRRAYLDAAASALPDVVESADAVGLWRAGRLAVQQRVAEAVLTYSAPSG